MELKVDRLIITILALIVIGGALYYSIGEYGSQRFIEGQRDYERLCIRQMTALTLSYVQFHSEIALNSLEQDSAGTFNLSMAELASDLSMLESNLVRSALYIFPEDFPDNETLANMTQAYQCITFVELSQSSFLNGTANVSTIREGLNLIHDFATEWRKNGNYPSEELLKANAELQQKCSALIQKIENP
ncbi:hypothetical protein [Thermococcus sp. 21S7]|uniref:hypothetical protein n=1 Tax=Thermococcus sp. 21S7 TaxID=1638221 RepID=UPI00143A8ECC|nr:hypothetical protein [Thermococcus sp. 21S7]NJE61554.1 hypothetical protein [Thermococcus sp. 21S7]